MANQCMHGRRELARTPAEPASRYLVVKRSAFHCRCLLNESVVHCLASGAERCLVCAHAGPRSLGLFHAGLYRVARCAVLFADASVDLVEVVLTFLRNVRRSSRGGSGRRGRHRCCERRGGRRRCRRSGWFDSCGRRSRSSLRTGGERDSNGDKCEKLFHFSSLSIQFEKYWKGWISLR